MTNEELIEIGTIVAPQGLKGELRVYANSDFPERFEQPGQRWLQRSPEKSAEPVELVSGRYIPGKDLYVVQLAGVETRAQAEALRNAKLFVPESDRPDLGDDEYHVRDLLNLQVINQFTGELVGVVVDVFFAGNTLLQVQLDQQPAPMPPKPAPTPPNRTSKIRKPKRHQEAKPVTVLIPFVRDIAPVVDLANGRIEITPPAGLLDLSLR